MSKVLDPSGSGYILIMALSYCFTQLLFCHTLTAVAGNPTLLLSQRLVIVAHESVC